MSQGKFSTAEPLAREAQDWNRRKRPDAWERFRSEGLLGATLAGQKKYVEAQPLLLAGYQGMLVRKERMSVADRIEIDLVGRWIDELYRAWGKPDQAANWRQNLAPAK